MTDDGDAARPREAALAIPPERWRALGHGLVDRLADELARLRERPIANGASPATVRSALDAARGLPAHGEDAGALIDHATTLLFEHATHAGHPRFHGYIAGTPAPIGVLAELLAAALNTNLALWRAAPMASEIEAQTMRWLAELVGYPATAAVPGLLTSGGSAANAIALQLALQRALPRYADDGIGPAQPRVYASEATHGWLGRAVEQAGLGRRAVASIATDARQRLRLDALAAAVAADRAAGRLPLMVVGNAGTVGSGAVDPLAALGALCQREALWFHIDGAYGAPAASLLGSAHAAALGDAAADLGALHAADSLALDPHKWLYAPIEAGALLVREPHRLVEAYGRERPDYYAAPDLADARDATATDFHALGPQNTRGFRALKVWLALRMAGRDGYRQMLADDIALAARLVDAVRARVPLVASLHQLSVASLRLDFDGARDDTTRDARHDALIAAVQRSGIAWVGAGRLDGRRGLRACITNFQTGAADIDATAALIARLAARPAG